VDYQYFAVLPILLEVKIPGLFFGVHGKPLTHENSLNGIDHRGISAEEHVVSIGGVLRGAFFKKSGYMTRKTTRRRCCPTDKWEV
jgi:hypothetical protein